MELDGRNRKRGGWPMLLDNLENLAAREGAGSPIAVAEVVLRDFFTRNGFEWSPWE